MTGVLREETRITQTPPQSLDIIPQPRPPYLQAGRGVTVSQKKLTGGSAQPGTTHPPPSRTRLQTATVHGDVR